MNYLVISPESWDSLPTNKHQISRRLSEAGAHVVYVDWHGIAFWRIWNLTQSWYALETSGPGLAPSVLVMPRLPLRFTRRWRSALRIDSALKASILTLLLLGKRFRAGRTLVYDPTAVCAARWLKKHSDVSLVYHCVDHVASFPEWGGSAKTGLLMCERQLLEIVDRTIVTSRGLEAHVTDWARKGVVYMPNVADVELFGQVANQYVAPEPCTSRPVLAFHGNLVSHKIDFNFLSELLDGLDAGTLLLIGPCESSSSRELLDVLVAKGAVYHPSMAQEDVVDILKTSDVLLLPYVISDHTKHVFPLKLMEYLATGRPIVATRLPSIVEAVGDTVAFASNGTEACLLIRSGKIRSERAADRVMLSKPYSWDARVTAISELFEAVEDGRG